jgi:uncharacterized protein YqiB (DUF1249 family)
MNEMVLMKTKVGFDRLMEAYERNYLALRMLLPDIDSWPDQQLHLLRASELLARDTGGEGKAGKQAKQLPELLAKVLERHIYTTDIWLSYQLIDVASLPIYVPDFSIRIYHDAQQAEVLQGTLKDHWKIKINDEVKIQSRWIVNQTLDVWLQHLRNNGYQYHDELAAEE